VKLLYFAWLRARVGCAEEEIELSPAVRDVAGSLRDLSIVRVAVNHDYVGLEHPVQEGDEVAIFPPVTGG
jgi:molybdopterin synthase sulfur carrier subunit